MTTPYEIDMSRIVYIKEVKVPDLPQQIIDTLPKDITTPLFAIYNAEGTPLSLAENRTMATAAARHYNLEPYSIH